MSDELKNPRHIFKRGDALRAKDLQRLADSIPAIRAGNGLTATQTGTSNIVIGLGRVRRQAPATFWAKITGYSAQGNNQWRYAWSEQVRTPTGWDAPGGARTGTTTADYALNSIEANNDDAAIEGNGVNVDNLNAGFSYQPVQGNPVVLMVEGFDKDFNKNYTFQYENAIDGTCE